MNDMWGMPNNGNMFPRYNPTGFGANILPHYEIIKVNGEAGAKNFRMGPNSDALLLDEKDSIVWHVQTDGAGYLSVMPYDLVPHQVVPPVDINLLNQRVSQLEEMINARQSNSQPNKQKKQRNTTATDIANSGNQTTNESI